MSSEYFDSDFDQINKNFNKLPGFKQFLEKYQQCVKENAFFQDLEFPRDIKSIIRDEQAEDYHYYKSIVTWVKSEEIFENNFAIFQKAEKMIKS